MTHPNPTAARQEYSSFMDLVLPPGALLLAGLWLVVIPCIILAGKSLLFPFFESLTTFIDSGEWLLPAYFWIKLTLFGLFAYFGGYYLFNRLSVLYIATWQQLFPRPDVLHVNYTAHPVLSTQALTRWHLYRKTVVMGPPLVMLAVLFLVFWGELQFFSMFGFGQGNTASLSAVIGLFIFLLTGLFTLFAIFNSVWSALATMYGSITAVTEPALKVRDIAQRCNRIVFLVKASYGVFLTYLLMLTLQVLGTVWIALLMESLVVGNVTPEVLLVLPIAALMLASYLGWSFQRYKAYHASLVRFYQKLPRQMRAEFSAPESNPAF